MKHQSCRTAIALVLAVLPLAAGAQEGFDPASCPSPVIRREGNQFVVTYDALVAQTLGSRPGHVPAIDGETGEVSHIDFAEGSIDDWLDGSGYELVARGPSGEACLAARAGLGTRAAKPVETAFDPASCPPPLLVTEDGRATLVYDPEMLAAVPARDGLVPLLDRATGKVWYYDPAETSLYDILTLHGARITDAHGPIECAMTAAGFPDPTRRTRDLILPDLDIGVGIPSGGDGGSGSQGNEGETAAPDPDPAPTPVQPNAACAGGPRDGTWTAEIGATQMQGCPPLMQQMFAQSPGALPGFGATPGRLAFACPFHPDTLELSRTARVRWQDAGANRWTTTDLAAAEFAMIPQGEGGGSHILWQMTLVSPEEITFERSIEIVLPAEAAAVMGASPDGCRVTGTDRWIRTGD